MMEPTDNRKEKEYQWAMKASVLKQDESDDWKNRRATPLDQLQTRMVYNNKYGSYDEGHLRIMASLVPDEILYNIDDYSKREFDACLLFGDVSGFTELCEKYNKTGKGGPSRLTQVLNAYIGAMVQEILSHSGDVLKFSGDAFIALFKETDHLSLRNAVHEAIDCSLVIQKTYGSYQADVDVVVRVKLAVSCGHLVFSLIGDTENSHYIMNGQPIFDIKAAESKSSAGEIVITARVSHHISANEYLIDLMPDGIHAKILGVGPNWRNIQRHYDHKADTRYSIVSTQDQESLLDESLSGSYEKLNNVEEDSRIASRNVNDQYALRQAVNYACRMKYKDELRKFIIAPVMRGIDAEEPLEYLTEIRQVAILFINVKVSGAITALEGIDVAHNVYVTVCNAVKNNYGCVNKISNFDKDLMLLVIFGLRGFKHELESQIALRCAQLCYEKLFALDNVKEVSAGVTTGKTYCGAFGHTLRREYTVIGLVVNKAARLMMAYPMKVTCDRETFLHSKLESRNFLLQEYKYLKGIANPGPIYEFKEVEKSPDTSLSINPLPLLGREQELDLYLTLAESARKHSLSQPNVNFTNMLIMKGVYRQGKTRILEEMMYITADYITCRIALTRNDYDIPYQMIRLIFTRFFAPADENLIMTEKMGRLRSKFKDTPYVPYLCLFNAVFDVDFEITHVYEEMDKVQKYKALQGLFKIFVRMCFPRFGIIAVDDSEYIDAESWLLIDIMLEVNTIFMVTTMGSEKELSVLVLQVLKNPNIKSIELKAIDKWYHVGLACQLLHVDGVPPELEKTIQLKSNGNPGWIESFLVSLTQSGGIIFNQMSRDLAYKSGYVLPPLYMLMRLTKEEIDLWMQIMEEETSSKHVNTRWKMFVDGCRESFPDLNVSQIFGLEVTKKDIVNIATISENFNLEDVDPEQAIDVIILKTFDALTSYEQLLLKCSAILGDIFPRDMLLYIMSSSAIRLTAVAVQKLFEIHVLSCARGNFIEGGLSFKDRLVNPNEDMSVKCDCRGLVIDEACMDLPKYASCGYIRFRSSEFREITYNLLTDNQKREFHEKAIRYLEKETRRCRSCGNGYFVRQMGGGRIDHFIRQKASNKSSKRKKSAYMASSFFEYDDFYTGDKETRLSFISGRGSIGSGGSSIRSKDIFRKEMTSIFSMDRGSTTGSLSLNGSENFLAMSHDLGIRTINKLKDNFNLTRTFSSIDYSQCTCMLILTTMFQQLIEHCKGACLAEKIMNATVEYSYVCIETQNIPQAVKVLEEALTLLEGPMKDQIELEWMVELKKGKLFTLLGRARSEINDREAYVYLINALKCYGIIFPKTSLQRKLRRNRFKLSQFLRFYFSSGSFSDRKVDDDVAEYCNNVSECLTFLCGYYIRNDKWLEAELTAVWSLNKALRTETDFEKMCRAYGNLIRVSSSLGRHRFCVALEVYALRTCHKKKTHVELDELKAVTFMYYAISIARLRRAEMEKFLHIGYVTWRLATSSQTEPLVFKILPILSFAVLTRRQIIEYGTLIQEVMYIVEQDKDNSTMAWYFALCLQLHLETGVAAQPYSKCLRFMQHEGLEPTLRDPDGKTRLVICIWLWEIRNENWDAARMYQKQAWSFKVKQQGESIQNLLTACYLLEGLIIYMVAKMDMKNLKEIHTANALIMQLFADLQKSQRYCKIFIPRLTHLRAYYKISKYNDYKGGLEMLKKAQKISDKYYNDLEMSWIKHSELAWLHKLSREEMEFWKEHADEDNMIDFRDVEFIDKFVQFSLPLPLYI